MIKALKMWHDKKRENQRLLLEIYELTNCLVDVCDTCFEVEIDGTYRAEEGMGEETKKLAERVNRTLGIG